MPNKTDEDDESQSTSCLEELAGLAASHFDNAFLSRTTANAKEHYAIFRDIWKYFHSGATSTAEEDKQEEDKQEEKENEDDYIDEEAMKRQRLSLGIPSAKDLDELNSSESDTDDEKLNPYSLGNSCRRSTHFFCCN